MRRDAIGIGTRLPFQRWLLANIVGAPKALLEIDHIIPVREGGGNNEANLITACFGCNRGESWSFYCR